MLDGVLTEATKLSAQLRAVDALDILLVSVLIYAALSWLQRAQSRAVVRGLAGVALLYLAARLLHLRLTLFIFQAVLAIAVVALVVIFQEDIRRAFERVAMTTRRGLRKTSTLPTGELVDTIVRSVRRLAQERTGALIIFKGRDPLERHLSGGVPLHGLVSESLLHSLFDDSSEGHDGAVVIDHGKVERFGVHLPLSTSLAAEGMGTRHTAAIGLSERSDALVVVVSEERGTISVARAGTLETVSDTEVKEHLTALVQELGPSASRPSTGWLRSTWLKLLSVVLATSGWALVEHSQSETMERTFTVPVVYQNVAPGWQLDAPEPRDARITVSGPVHAFEDLATDRVRIGLDAEGVRVGKQSMTLDSGLLNLPAGLRAERVDPQSVTVVAHRTETLRLPVVAKTSGRPPPGFAVSSIEVDPEMVEVIVREDQRKRYKRLETAVVDLSELKKTASMKVRVVLPEFVRSVDGEAILVNVKAVAGRTPREE